MYISHYDTIHLFKVSVSRYITDDIIQREVINLAYTVFLGVISLRNSDPKLIIQRLNFQRQNNALVILIEKDSLKR